MICETSKCTGCYACINICPKKCIHMEEDELGHVYPVIDQNECINCHLCKKVCPSLNTISRHETSEVYASWVLNEKERGKSTSGGLATCISQNFLMNEGVVYGAAYVDGEIRHIRITDSDELDQIRGSKYVHSYIRDSFAKVHQDLSVGKKVLFIGTPCQIAGLKTFLKVKNVSLQITDDCLYTIDIVCHGVPSQRLLKEELSGIDSFDSISFRNSDGFILSVKKEGKAILQKPYYLSKYYRAFLERLTYRDSCYTCQFANSKRVGDITLGDFWKLGELKGTKKEEDKGISLLMVHTDKGNSLFTGIRDRVFIEKRSLEEAVAGNDQLQAPSVVHPDRNQFIKNLNTIGYDKAMLKALHYYSIVNILKRFVLRNQMLVSFIKKFT